MIRSMTAFSSEERTENGIAISVEIRCYNSRHLDLSVRLPSMYAGLEEIVRQTVSGLIQRGRVEVRIGIRTEKQTVISFTINEDLADAYYEALNRIRKRYFLPDPVSLTQMVQSGSILEPVETEIDVSDARTLLEEIMVQAVHGLNRMRDEEGEAIRTDITHRLNLIETYTEEIERHTGDLLQKIKARLIDRINELTGGVIEIDQGRVIQEAAILADKSDISEELTRSRSHLNQFKKLMDGTEPAGKPLNFLLQEFTREFNTMGSKVGNAEVAHIIVMAKTELEKIREQVQNVE